MSTPSQRYAATIVYAALPLLHDLNIQVEVLYTTEHLYRPIKPIQSGLRVMVTETKSYIDVTGNQNTVMIELRSANGVTVTLQKIELTTVAEPVAAATVAALVRYMAEIWNVATA